MPSYFLDHAGQISVKGHHYCTCLAMPLETMQSLGMVGMFAFVFPIYFIL